MRQTELAAARSELTFLQAQLARTEGRVEFSEADRDSLLGQLDVRLKSLDAERDAGLAAADRARKAIADAQSQLEAARAKPAGKRGADEKIQPPPERFQRAAELAQMRLETAQTRTNVLRLMISSVEQQRAVWGTSFDIARARDDDTVRQLAVGLDAARQALRTLNTTSRATFRYTLGQISELDRAILTSAGADTAYLKDKYTIVRERAEWQARLLADLGSSEDLADRLSTGFASEAGQKSELQRVEELKFRATALAHAVWNFELFTAEDTIEVEGRKLTAARSITLGKVVSAVLILVIGLLIGRVTIRLACRFAVRFLKADVSVANLAGKWIFALVFVMLFLLSLMTVKIPFTVFAFLGGAVAIGVGFGMQALFKNLISGVMVLTERPFRLGDIVEVGAVRGQVTDINLRSSLLRNRDGIETLVPNSTFIEQNVTNWTYPTRHARYTLNVGVAYGSPTDKVHDVLLAAGQRHGVVLKSPAPEVFFEDFGNDALAFSLQFWLDLTDNVDSRRIASGLRFMIEKSFAEEGIAIPFPQRDVHFDAAQPIPVRVVAPAETGGGQ